MLNGRFLFFMGLTLTLLGVISGCESKQSDIVAQTELEKASGNIIKGQELYLSYGCAVCHGKNGDGNGLSGKIYYPPPIDFHDPKAYRHGNTKDDIRNTIRFGVQEANSGMPAFDHITEQELDQLTDFLMSLQKKENK